jgi:hypothetical protein
VCRRMYWLSSNASATRNCATGRNLGANRSAYRTPARGASTAIGSDSSWLSPHRTSRHVRRSYPDVGFKRSRSANMDVDFMRPK